MPMTLSEILLVTDCDGTLLQNDQSIAEEDISAIRAFREAGGNFTVATGRSIPTGAQVLRQLKLTLPCVLYNGSMLYDPVGGEIFWTAEVPSGARFLVREVLERFGAKVGIEVLTPEGMWVLSFNQLVDAHLNGRCSAPYQVVSYDDIAEAHWLKVMFAMPEAMQPEFASFLRQFSAEGVRFVRSEKLFFEILPAGASKGSALKRLCRKTGLQLSRTVAIGDCDNDLEMLMEARVGVAVANAYPDLRAAADVVTVSNQEHAVAAVIGELLRDPDKYLAQYGKGV